jgi:hypothetical protein
MHWSQGLILFLHVGAGAAWLGASIFANFVLLPFISRQQLDRRRELVGSLIVGPERLIIGGALAAALTGLVLGIGYGGIRSVDALTTTYGVLWLASVLVAMGVFMVGGRVTSPAARGLRDDPSLWAGDSATVEVMVAPLLDRLRLGFRVELIGIVVVLGLMVGLAQA